MEIDIATELKKDRVPFVIAWEPIVQPTPHNNPNVATKVVGGEIHLIPKSGADSNQWWNAVMASDQGEQIQSTLELVLSAMADTLGVVPRWHIALHPHVRPQLRIAEILDLWNAQEQALNLVYMLPVDEPADPAVWEEIAAIQRAKQLYGDRPILAASHVGRSGLSVELAESLNDGPFTMLHLDPSVSAGLTGRMDRVPGNDERFGALADFLQALDSRIPVVATGIQTEEEWQAVAALRVRYGQGPLWMAPDPIHNTFSSPAGPKDPREFTWPGTLAPDWTLTPTMRLYQRARRLHLGGPLLAPIDVPPGARVLINGYYPDDDPDFFPDGTLRR